jgi:hypothetical protein
MPLHFLVCGRLSSAGEFAEARDWRGVGYGRYLTPGGNDVRAVRRMADMTPALGIIQLIKCHDFAESSDVGAFEALVKTGAARWLKV